MVLCVWLCLVTLLAIEVIFPLDHGPVFRAVAFIVLVGAIIVSGTLLDAVIAIFSRDAVAVFLNEGRLIGPGFAVRLDQVVEVRRLGDSKYVELLLPSKRRKIFGTAILDTRPEELVLTIQRAVDVSMKERLTLSVPLRK